MEAERPCKHGSEGELWPHTDGRRKTCQVKCHSRALCPPRNRDLFGISSETFHVECCATQQFNETQGRTQTDRPSIRGSMANRPHAAQPQKGWAAASL